jgi:hypothetical protein
MELRGYSHPEPNCWMICDGGFAILHNLLSSVCQFRWLLCWQCGSAAVRLHACTLSVYNVCLCVHCLRVGLVNVDPAIRCRMS